MRPLKTTLFIFCVLGLMAALSIVWPHEGVTLGSMTLNWPSLEEVMQNPNSASSAEAQETPALVELTVEEVMAQELKVQEDEATTAPKTKEEAFVSFTHTSDIRIFLPNDSAEYLDNFFSALENAPNKQVRILHYGDSQIEEDRITSRIRNNLQNQFGGIGVGMEPPVIFTQKMTINVNSYPELPYNILYGLKQMRATDNRYGPLLQVCRTQDRATVAVRPCNYTSFTKSRQFNRLGVLVDGMGRIEVKAADSTYLLTADTLTEMQQLCIDLPQAVTEADFRFEGNWNIYSLLLDGQTGVSVDNIPMRGYAGTTFSLIDKSTMQPFFDAQNVGLIILQFGGNAVPGLTSDQSIEAWKAGIGQQINYFHRLAPEACILMIGPADMSTNVNGEMQTYPQLPKVVNALKEAALSHNAAFWSMYDAMGGWNSMTQWVNARPQLAGEDFIHFTHKGANKMADLLNQVIDQYYQNYLQRKQSYNQNNESQNNLDSVGALPLSADVASTDSL